MTRQYLKKNPVKLEEILNERQNFPWEWIDFNKDLNQKAFIDKIIEKKGFKDIGFYKGDDAEVLYEAL